MVVTVSLIPIPYRIIALTQERNSLLDYSAERLAGIIKEIGFRCDGCAQCCTRAFNGHVFLLDRDVTAVKKIDPAALEPAPRPEFCDQNGIFYDSGYALRTKGDKQGSCWFLENKRCRIYDQRFTIPGSTRICHREPDEKGKVDWRQISGSTNTGSITPKSQKRNALRLPGKQRSMKKRSSSRGIAFLEFMNEYFKKNDLPACPEGL